MESFFKRLKDKYASGESSGLQELEDLERIWNISGKRKPIKPPDKALEWERIEQRLTVNKPKNKLMHVSFVRKLAASILILLASGALIYILGFKTNVYQTLSDTKIVELPDGSEVTLNKNSELVVKAMFNKWSRNVELTGEAYFKVTKAKHPFVISTKVAQITVVGTKFNVNARPAKVELAVNEGIVDFCNIKDLDHKIRVPKGFLSNCTKNSKPEQPQKILLDNYPGWIYGKLSFQNNTIAEICSALESSYNIKIDIREDSISTKIITGTLDSSDPEEIIKILCTLIHQNYKIEQDKYVIY